MRSELGLADNFSEFIVMSAALRKPEYSSGVAFRDKLARVVVIRQTKFGKKMDKWG